MFDDLSLASPRIEIAFERIAGFGETLAPRERRALQRGAGQRAAARAIRRAGVAEGTGRLSISHSGLWACAAAACDGQVRGLGVDFEYRSAGAGSALEAQELVFTTSERRWLELEPGRFWSFWTAKEAILKALGSSDLPDPRCIELDPPTLQAVVALPERGFRRFAFRTWERAEGVLSVSWPLPWV